MPTIDSGKPLKDFLSSLSNLSGASEEDLVAAYVEALQYPELRGALEEQKNTILLALKDGDAPALEATLRQTFVNFEKTLSGLPEQVASPLKEYVPEEAINREALEIRSKKITETLRDSPKILEEVRQSTGATKREYIQKLVNNYSKWVPHREGAAQTIADTLVVAAQSSPEASIETIVDQSIPLSFPGREDLATRLHKDNRIAREVETIQKETPRELPNSFIEEVVSSPDPAFFKDSFVQEFTTTNKSGAAGVEAAITKAATLSAVASALEAGPQGGIDYSGFFKNISANGAVMEKTIAPLADAVFSVFPKGAQEAVVLKVLGSSWNKEVSNNAWLQQSLGGLLQSPSVHQAIQNGNALFASSGHGTMFTKTQSFFVDVFTTVFHPEVSGVYLQLAHLNNTQMGMSVGSYYLGLLAERGIMYAGKKGAKSAAKTIAKKVATKTIGKTFGALFGSAGGPAGTAIGTFIGDVLLDKVIGGLWRGAQKAFGFITLDWLGKFMSGRYESGPITKDPTFIAAAVLVGAVCLLFVIPLAPFALGGNSPFQQTVQDNAFIQGLGGPGSTTPTVDCAAEPDNPLCSMTACNEAAQDCRWPTTGHVTQGPFTSCGGSHGRANAIDIGAANGTDVYATMHGTVTKVFSGCVDNTGYWRNVCGGGYGNHVIIQGPSYTLKFGHLSQLSIAVHEGQTVTPTMVIGEVDDNGNSSGPHLHFEYIGPGSINSILPTAVPVCSNNTPGCPQCPIIYTGGGR